MTESKVYYWLSLSGLSARRVNILLRHCAPLEIWELFDSPAVRENAGDKNYERMRHFRDEDYLNRSLETLRLSGIRVVTRASDKFPEKLAQREVNPPCALYYKGDVSLLSAESVAVVGTRRCTRYGKDMAERFSEGLARAGLCVVSGLATGVDAFAEAAVLAAGGKTVAVLGSGLNRVTPVSNYKLFDRICETGLVVSEYPPETEGSKFTFPERNRIISALSRGVLVVEAGERSGALITAAYALEQGRELYALPGNLTSTQSKGTNNLIARGEARLVRDVNDILDDLSYAAPAQKKRTVTLDFTEETIFSQLSEGEKTFDELVEILKIPPPELSAALTSLEISGIIRKLPSNLYRLEP